MEKNRPILIQGAMQIEIEYLLNRYDKYAKNGYTRI